MQDERKDQSNENASVRPDPETLHKTDPQDNMKGPVSSLMHNAGEGFETAETKKEADEKKDKNT
jgi:hypothetical protein